MDNIKLDKTHDKTEHEMEDISNHSESVHIPKTRGRKKKVVEQLNDGNNENNNNDKPDEKNLEILQIEQVKKKRGRKKKWEVETTTKLIDSCPILFMETKNENKNREIEENYEEHNVSFGNLNIKVHSNKEAIIVDDIKDNLKKENDSSLKCKIDLTNSDYEDFEEECDSNRFTHSDKLDKSNKSNKSNKIVLDYTKSIRQSKIIEKNIKLMKYFVDEFDNGNEILVSPYRCYHCHNTFNNKPFFLPIEYNSELKRFKVTGNFCSPNCVKAYGLNSKTYCNKVYLIGFMYRILFGTNYNIKPAPPIQCLKEYGGKLTIQEYRATFDNNKQYNLKDICSKVLMNEVISN